MHFNAMHFDANCVVLKKFCTVLPCLHDPFLLFVKFSIFELQIIGVLTISGDQRVVVNHIVFVQGLFELKFRVGVRIIFIAPVNKSGKMLP